MAKKRAGGEGTLYRKSDGRWEMRYEDPREADPKKRTKYITGKKQKDVTAKLKERLKEIEKEEKVLSKENPTMGAWADKWMEEYAVIALRKTTYQNYESSIKLHIKPLIGNIKLKQLTDEHIEDFYNTLLRKKADGGHGLSPASITKIKNVLSGSLKKAVVKRIISQNPADKAEKPKVVDPKIRIITNEEQKSFLSVLHLYNAGNMYAFALATGMRIGEVCAMNIDDIDWKHNLMVINKTTFRVKDRETDKNITEIGQPKTPYSDRIIPLMPSVKVIVQRQLQLIEEMKKRTGVAWVENELLFPNQTGTVRDYSGVRTTFERIVERAGISNPKNNKFTPHGLRHKFATTALNAGVAPQNVANFIGHKDGATTLRFYAHYINTEAEQQLQNLEVHNIVNFDITSSELGRVQLDTLKPQEKTAVKVIIDKAIHDAKSASPKKSIDMVLKACNDILCEPISNLCNEERDILLNTLGQYTYMKNEEEKKMGIKSRER